MKKRIIAALCAVMLLPAFGVHVNAEYKESDLKNAVNKAIEWKDRNDSPHYSIGTNNSNLYITALKRMGKKYEYNTYLLGLDDVAAGYNEENDASDMQRTALATLASGGEPRNVGGRDLIADSTYYRDAAAPIDKEGVNGYSWALITLDSKQYAVPDWAAKNRNDIIVGILSHQNTDGSFDGSVYATASAIVALTPYAATSGSYTITQIETGDTFDISPRTAVHKALDYLSAEQLKDGDWGELRATAMAIIALDTVGIDADGDDRFTANKGTALEGLMSYQGRNGGFSANGHNADGEATSIALCALTSHLRKMQGKARFFDFTVEDSITLADPTPTPKATATAKPKTTTKPSSKVTSKPRATVKPSTKSTSKPSGTLKPTKTASPQSDADKLMPSFIPRATRRPALVGPVEMIGPIQSLEPIEPPSERADAPDAEKNNAVPAVIVTAAILLMLCAAAIVWYLNKKGRIPDNNILKRLIDNFGRKSADEPYKAKRHRKTEEYRHYEERERYNQRRKYDKRRRK
ncbi:MAG: terpene cyclase/mutase family protein [Clostridia bacterium]|nr:terpene cyclase/mutase family protein [Clostridia bacterium]